MSLLRDVAEIILVIIIVCAACFGAVLGVSTLYTYGNTGGPDAGIVITHTGQPVDNILVTVSNGQKCGSNQPYLSGTTDGTGSFTFPTGRWWTPCTFLYSFTFNGSTYAFVHDNHSILKVDF